jgi:hypothetical protein
LLASTSAVHGLSCSLLLLLLLASVLSGLGCDEPSSSRAEIAAVSAAPPLSLRVPFELYGVPGPWWRDNATQQDFDSDQKQCRDLSRRARDEADPETRRDGGYRAFVDCMGELAWTRGYPPAPEPVGSAG